MSIRNITEREKAAVKYAIAFGEKSSLKLYRIAYDGSEADLNKISSINSVASRWWNSKKIQAYFREQAAAYDSRLKSVADKAVTDYVSKLATAEANGESLPALTVDYSRPDNMIRELNRIIADAGKDDKTKLDAIKVLAAQTSREQDSGSGSDIHRFYTSLKCRDCVLYLKAKEEDKLNK